jgi:hypothetical protein
MLTAGLDKTYASFKLELMEAIKSMVFIFRNYPSILQSSWGTQAM